VPLCWVAERLAGPRSASICQECAAPLLATPLRASRCAVDRELGEGRGDLSAFSPHDTGGGCAQGVLGEAHHTPL